MTEDRRAGLIHPSADRGKVPAWLVQFPLNIERIPFHVIGKYVGRRQPANLAPAHTGAAVSDTYEEILVPSGERGESFGDQQYLKRGSLRTLAARPVKAS